MITPRAKLLGYSSSALLALLLNFASSAFGQVSITMGSLTYTQSFDTLLQSGVATWQDNAPSDTTNGLVGWYANASTLPDPFQIAGTDGGVTTTGQVKSYGSDSSSDRALGTLPGDTNGAMRLAVRFVNNTGSTIQNFTVTYDGEQWRRSSASNINNQYTFGYQIFNAGAGGISTGTYTTIDSLTFDTPQDGLGASATSLDGNSAAYRVAELTGTASASLAPGQELWLRWFDSNSSGIDHGIAIDNLSVSFTAIPEPSTYAALLGLAGLALVAWRRRVQQG